jgi:hypothetical protein
MGTRFLRLRSYPFRLFAVLFLAAFQAASTSGDPAIPPALQPWIDWATWENPHRNCPTPYSDPKAHRCFWPGRLQLTVDAAGGRFEMEVTAFHATWIPLPGSAEMWPQGVADDGKPLPVVEHGGAPSVRIGTGAHRITGRFAWTALPQNLRVPQAVGLLSLNLGGQPVETPAWDPEGLLWFRREAGTEAREKDFLSLKLAAALEDGIPMWWQQEIELTVSGRSREEDLGVLLPEGWKLASVEGPLPVAVDSAGRFKVQARPGKWILAAHAFRLDNPKALRFAEKPSGAPEQFVAFRSKPDFRVLELVGAPSVDVSQVAFPDRWRQLPVYRWDLGSPLQLGERLRGMGDQKPGGLAIVRELWLDEDGRGLTFRDQLTGKMQQVWRLDAAEGQELGSVESGGQGLLVTFNPVDRTPGVELRSRELDIKASGRMGPPESLSASGWKADAESVDVTLHLPPGWRLFALFGADWVQGDWLTAWTLLDLFLLLVFALAVHRLRGWKAAVLAFLAFGLAYHEPRAPKFLWLLLLVPMALMDVLAEGRARRFAQAGFALAFGALLFALLPFIGRQAELALYPQLEVDQAFQFRTTLAEMGQQMQVTSQRPMTKLMVRYGVVKEGAAPPPASNAAAEDFQANRLQSMNLQYDSKARIQTGPGIPEWEWRAVRFGWRGPVAAGQKVRPVLIPLGLERLLTVLRMTLLIAVAVVLVRGRKTTTKPKAPYEGPSSGMASATGAAAALILFATAFPEETQAAETNAAAARGDATFPDESLLRTLRDRLSEPSDAFPNAASIPSAVLRLADRKVTLEAEVHAAVRTAVPLPGRLPTWSPVSVVVDGQPAATLRRDDGYLWVVLDAGVHKVRVEGSLAGVGEWQWTYRLRPRHVRIEAPGWTQAGVRPDGVPEPQVFLAPERKAVGDQARYEQQELDSVVQVDRTLEIGLQWQVRTEVRRLSGTGRAVSLRIPLLPGENVLSAGRIAAAGFVEVRLGAQETVATWESSLAITNTLPLASRASDTWVERWRLVASPVWNVTLAGLPPVFEAGNAELIPVWQPWPGESVTLSLRRPEAIPGNTVTIHRIQHSVSLGQRQRTSELELGVRSSLGEDFLLELPTAAEITRLTQDGKEIPVRRDAGRLIIPLHPGVQALGVSWREAQALTFRAHAPVVRLPAESANVLTRIDLGADRWILWTDGPRRGPAVRFWGILLSSLMAAAALGRIPKSPLRTAEWMLLVIGLTQTHLAAGAAVVAWFFLLRWRSGPSFQALPSLAYNALQLLLVALTVAVLVILVVVVGEGLLGSPKMFLRGNGSYGTHLEWFQPRSGNVLPECSAVSVSIWWYRFLMLLWALWLASGLLRWLASGWKAFAEGGLFRSFPVRAPRQEAVVPTAAPTQTPGPTPPPVPGASGAGEGSKR